MSAILAGILSAALMGTFSAETQANFMTSCAAGTDKAVCNCVLQKLEAKYTEIEFKNMEMSLLMGKEAPGYMDFVVNARIECNAAGKPAGSATGSLVAAAGVAQPKSSVPTEVQAPVQSTAAQVAKPAASNGAPSRNASASVFPSNVFSLSGADLMILQALIGNNTFKSNFVNKCVDEGDDYLGAKQAKKSCLCAYDRLSTNDSLASMLMKMTSANGDVNNFEQWGFDLLVPCLPSQFSAEMEKAFMNECTGRYKGEKKACQCAYNQVKQTYTVQSLVQSAILDGKKFESSMQGVVGACSAK